MLTILNKYKYMLILLLIIVVSIIYMLPRGDEKMEMTLNVTSPAFTNGDNIPEKYTGRGEDISIPLELYNVVSSGKSIVVIMDDPDAPTGTFTHWLIWDIPATIKNIFENIGDDVKVSSLGGATQGENDFGRVGYMGPNPPSGTHTYRIKVYVIDKFLNLSADSSKEVVEKAMKGHILQYGLLEGKFKK